MRGVGPAKFLQLLEGTTVFGVTSKQQEEEVLQHYAISLHFIVRNPENSYKQLP